MAIKKTEYSFVIDFLNHMREIDPGKKLTYIIMFDGVFNVKLGRKTFEGALSKVDNNALY